MSAVPYTSLPQDMSQFVYREPIVNKNKSRTSYINKSATDQSNPRYQMTTKDEPRLRAPYGISKPFDEKQADSDRKNLDLSVESDSLLKVLNELDEHNIQVAHKNCKAWFGKELPIDTLRFMYCPLVKHDKNGKYRPTFRTKVNTNKDSDNATRFFVIEEADGQVNYIEKDSSIVGQGSCVVPVVVPSMWFGNTQFGGTLTCTDAIVFSSGTKREDFPFQWGDAKAVPMEVQESAPETQDNPQPEKPETQQSNDGWVPPSGPHA
jgi:hypothetical protein